MTKLILVFGESGQKLLDDTVHWALMFTALACTTGFAYFLVGWASIILSTVSYVEWSLVTTCYDFLIVSTTALSHLHSYTD